MKIGLVKSTIDAHTLGLSTVASLLEECGVEIAIAPPEICNAVDNLNIPSQATLLLDWINQQQIFSMGFSYRLDPQQGFDIFKRLVHSVGSNSRALRSAAPLKFFFAGLPKACSLVKDEFGDSISVFVGDETPLETLNKLGVSTHKLPSWLLSDSRYDSARIDFGKELIDSQSYLARKPLTRPDYQSYGTWSDDILQRLSWYRNNGGGVLCRAHVGPYLPDRMAALAEFDSWLKNLADTGHLDIVSVGSSQLTQERFGQDWTDLSNGGGVPINSETEFRYVRDAARHMLVRAYSGTKDIPNYAAMLDRTMNCAWHALSLWWFNLSDGRGPLSVCECLQNHVDTLAYIASAGKPFEPNVAHHFSFRGADDLSAIVATYLAIAVAKAKGVKTVIMQTMLNTPKITSGISDLAKFKALHRLLIPLCRDGFMVYLQPRAGLSYFSPDLYKARVQLAAVSAMMDDLEPDNQHSPAIVHVVSYSEAVELANPQVINESVQITREAIHEYRRRGIGKDLIAGNQERELLERTEHLYQVAKTMISHMEAYIPSLYSAQGLYEVYRMGYFAVPSLWDCREELSNAVAWKTKVVNGSTQVVDGAGKPMSIEERLFLIEETSKLKRGLFL